MKRLVPQPAVREQWLWRVARNLSNCLICIINSESSHSPQAEINRKCIQANFQKEVICFLKKGLGLRSHKNWISITQSSNPPLSVTEVLKAEFSNIWSYACRYICAAETSVMEVMGLRDGTDLFVSASRRIIINSLLCQHLLYNIQNKQASKQHICGTIYHVNN